MRFNIDTTDGKTTVSDKMPVVLDGDETVQERVSDLMESIFQPHRIYVSFRVGNRDVYFNPSNIVSITPVDESLRSM